jgi:hypothetical protein
MKRGRKSSASLSIVPIDVSRQRPEAPTGLTSDQAAVWSATVGSTPAGWFSEGDALLTIYCRHVATSDKLAAIINAYDLKSGTMARFGRLLAMRERETRMITHLATKMRLTQQARMHSRSAARAFEAEPRSEPWECD